MEGIIFLLIIAVAICVSWLKTHQPTDWLDFYSAERMVKQMNDTATKIKTLEAIITNIERCDSKHTKNFTLSFIDEVSGEKYEYDFWISNPKSQVAKELATTAELERINLRVSMQEDIKSVSQKARRKYPDVVAIKKEVAAKRMEKKYLDDKRWHI